MRLCRANQYYICTWYIHWIITSNIVTLAQVQIPILQIKIQIHLYQLPIHCLKSAVAPRESNVFFWYFPNRFARCLYFCYNDNQLFTLPLQLLRCYWLFTHWTRKRWKGRVEILSTCCFLKHISSSIKAQKFWQCFQISKEINWKWIGLFFECFWLTRPDKRWGIEV